MYEYAQVQTGALPHESIMIGDNLAIDVVGAANFGWDAIHYNINDEKHEYKSVKSLLEIPDLLLK